MISELLYLQKKVDEIIEKKINKEFIKTVDERKIAFKVELAELANETGFFKYWKKSHVKNDERIKDEWADCLAFLLSIVNTYHFDREIGRTFERIPMKCMGCSLETKFNQLQYNKLYDYVDFVSAINDLYKFGMKFGYSGEELNEAYRIKTKENIRRATEGY